MQQLQEMGMICVSITRSEQLTAEYMYINIALVLILYMCTFSRFPRDYRGPGTVSVNERHIIYLFLSPDCKVPQKYLKKIYHF